MRDQVIYNLVRFCDIAYVNFAAKASYIGKVQPIDHTQDNLKSHH